MSLTVPLLLATGVLLIGVLAVKASTYLGLPSLLIYLGLGVLLGSSGFGIAFSDVELAQNLGTLALAVILAEGGLTTNWKSVRPHLNLGIALSTIAVAVSISVMALFMVLALGMSWQLAVVAGAIVSSTDAAAVFSVLRSLGLPRRITGALELESGLNDAPVILLVMFLSVPLDSIQPWWQIVLLLVFELAAGAAIGIAIGYVAAWLMRRGALPSSGLYPLLAMGFLLLAYSAANAAHASGFLAAYAAGVVLGNANLPYKRAVISFAEGCAWIAQIGLFVMLGLLIFPNQLPEVLIPALLIGLVLLFVARPLSVFAAASPLRVPIRSQVFFSWAGLRGAVPIVLATIPIANGLEGGWELLHMVFVLVVIFTLVQGTTLPWMARRLHLAGSEPTRDLEVEVTVLDEMAADLMTVDISETSKLHGVYVADLRLPAPTAVSLVMRDGAAFVPSPQTRLRSGDQLLVVTTSEVRDVAESRLRAIARSGRLAQWRGDDGHER